MDPMNLNQPGPVPQGDPNDFGRLQPPYQLPPHPGQQGQAPPPVGAQPQAQPGLQPVAYDNQGRPLYAHQPGQPQMVYMARPAHPEHPPISEEIKARHAQSQKAYSWLNLSDAEYIISAVKRHPIGILRIWAIAALIIFGLVGLFAAVFMQGGAGSAQGTDASIVGGSTTFATIGLGIIAVMMILVAVGALVATYVYNNNRFFLTNESVIQETQSTIFAKHEQTVSLANIEDASYEQNGILPHLLNYGRIRLSTEGDETTYRFNYVANPKKEVAVLNNAVEAFKNGRPVDPNDD